MKVAIALVCLILFATAAVAGPPPRCATIQGGTITDVNNIPIQTGYDQWGYNYQAMIFNGFYDNYTRPPVPATSGDSLEMKWNDAWLSNKDCDGDGKLDRHYGYPTYIGSGAWLTNHQRGTYEQDGKTYKWEYFIKIVAVPADAVLVDGRWKTPAGVEIGPAIWGEFAIIQEVYNDQGTGDHGILYKSPAAPGFGVYKP
jgi:hypothetical protein